MTTTAPTPEEIAKYTNMAHIMVSKAILSSVVHVLEEKKDKSATDEAEIRDIAGVLEEKMCKHPGCLGLEFDDHDKMVLQIYLTVVKKGYVATIDVPSAEYAHDLYRQYDLVKRLALTYWKHFQMTNVELMERCAKLRPDLTFDLEIDRDNATTLYFDPLSPSRMGVFPMYVDKKGQPYFKKK